MLGEIRECYWVWRIDHRIACLKAGYPESEAMYPNLWRYIITTLRKHHEEVRQGDLPD